MKTVCLSRWFMTAYSPVQGISKQLLEWKGIEATERFAESKNAKNCEHWQHKERVACRPARARGKVVHCCRDCQWQDGQLTVVSAHGLCGN